MLLGRDQVKVLKDHTWKFILVICWIISNFSKNIGEDIATRLYFLLLSIIFILIFNNIKNENWINYTLWELSIYNFIDEFLNMGDKYSDWELPILIFAFISSYIKFNKK